MQVAAVGSEAVEAGDDNITSLLCAEPAGVESESFTEEQRKDPRIFEVIQMLTCGVPEALLSDSGTNLLSHLMKDTCKLLGIRKLNTTAYYPQCDRLMERYNRTLNTALRKHAAQFGMQISMVAWYCVGLSKHTA